MSLRFQKEDEVERTKKETFGPAWLSVVIILVAVVLRGWGWLAGVFSPTFESFLVWVIAICIARLVVRVILADIDGLDSRTKEIDGKVSVIERAVSEKVVTVSRIEWTVNASREDLAELLERLTSIEGKVENLNPGACFTHSTYGIREGLRTIDARVFAINATATAKAKQNTDSNEAP